MLSAKEGVFSALLLWTGMRVFRTDRGLDRPDTDYVYFTLTGGNSP
jgi:hypothetical protein